VYIKIYFVFRREDIGSFMRETSRINFENNLRSVLQLD